MSIGELLEIINKSKFQSLIIKHNFRPVYNKHESKGGIQENCSVGFESPECKLGFYCEATVGVSVIPKFSDWETATWVDLNLVISYVLKQPISHVNFAEKHLNKHQLYQEKLINVLSDLAEKFEPLYDEILNMFKDQDTLDQWYPSLKQFIREDTRRRYNVGGDL